MSIVLLLGRTELKPVNLRYETNNKLKLFCIYSRKDTLIILSSTKTHYSLLAS